MPAEKTVMFWCYATTECTAVETTGLVAGILKLNKSYNELKRGAGDDAHVNGVPNEEQ